MAAPVTTRGFHNCYLAFNYCPIYIYGTNLPENCEVKLPGFEDASLVNVVCKDNMITGQVEFNPQSKIMQAVLLNDEVDVTFDVYDTDLSSKVASQDIAYGEPTPSLTNSWENCFSEEENCPHWVEGFGFSKNMTIEAYMYWRGKPVTHLNTIVDSYTLEKGQFEYTNVMKLKLSNEADAFVKSNCHVLIDYIAKDSSGNYVDTYFPGVVIDKWDGDCVGKTETGLTPPQFIA